MWEAVPRPGLPRESLHDVPRLRARPDGHGHAAGPDSRRRIGPAVAIQVEPGHLSTWMRSSLLLRSRWLLRHYRTSVVWLLAIRQSARCDPTPLLDCFPLFLRCP